MKLKFQSPKGKRIKYGFIGFCAHKNETEVPGYWWYNTTKKQWEFICKEHNTDGTSGYCTHAPCNSVRAFRRKLKKSPKGIRFILVSRWVGGGVRGKGSQPTINSP